jgi:hypothetical protein
MHDIAYSIATSITFGYCHVPEPCVHKEASVRGIHNPDTQHFQRIEQASSLYTRGGDCVTVPTQRCVGVPQKAREETRRFLFSSHAPLASNLFEVDKLLNYPIIFKAHATRWWSP